MMSDTVETEPDGHVELIPTRNEAIERSEKAQCDFVRLVTARGYDRHGFGLPDAVLRRWWPLAWMERDG